MSTPEGMNSGGGGGRRGRGGARGGRVKQPSPSGAVMSTHTAQASGGDASRRDRDRDRRGSRDAGSRAPQPQQAGGRSSRFSDEVGPR
jgi:hypothetical protein